MQQPGQPIPPPPGPRITQIGQINLTHQGVQFGNFRFTDEEASDQIKLQLMVAWAMSILSNTLVMSLEPQPLVVIPKGALNHRGS